MKKRIAISLIAIAAVIGWLVLRGRDATPQTRQQVTADIDGNLEQLTGKGFAGSVLLEERGDVIIDKGYGLADRSTGRRVSPSTGFDIGSLVKPFTMIAVLKLETAGKLRRSDPLARFFPAAPADKRVITIQQLLDHSSGLPDIVDSGSRPVTYTPDFDYEPVSRDEIVRRALNATLLSAPGAKARYSNLGYSLLGAIIERVSGTTYEQFVQTAVFRPAGMTRSGYLSPAWRNPDLAVGYRGKVRWGTPLEHRWLSDGPSWNLRANGGMLSTTQDLARWLHAIDGTALLTTAEKKAFFEMAVRRNARGTRTMGAAGSNEIFDGCYLWYIDEHRLLVMLTSSDEWRAEEMIPDLAKKMRRIRAPAPLPRTLR